MRRRDRRPVSPNFNHRFLHTHTLLMTRITPIGHATVLVEMGGARLITDPLLRPRVGHLSRYRRISRPPGRTPVDAVLISHLHWDHLDLPSLRRFGRDQLIFTPRGSGAFLRRRGFRAVEEVAAGQRFHLGAVSIQVTHAEHDGYRPFAGPRTDCVGYLLREEKQIYFAGDTDLFPGMETLAEQLDLALLPVWGWGPTLGSGHLNPYRAAKALALLRPEVAIPIHWGTFHPIGMGWLNPRFLTEPPREFAAHARVIAPETRVEIVRPGEPFSWPA